MKRVTAIARKTLRMILEASRDMYPREFGAILRAEEGTITELILVPGTVSGKRHAIFQLHTLLAAVLDHLPNARDVRDDDWFRGRHRLECDDSERLEPGDAREHEHVARRVDLWEVLFGDPPKKADPVGHAHGMGEALHRLEPGA